MKRLISFLAVLCLAVPVFGAANITLTSIAVSSDGKSITATLGGGSGAGFGITNGNGIIITAGSLRRLLTGQSVAGTTLTLTIGFPIGSGNTVTLSTNSGTSSTIFDSGANTVQTYTNTSVTNNSTTTVTGYNSNNSAFRLIGAYTNTVSNNRNLYTNQPVDSGFAVRFTGSDVALVCQTGVAFAVSVDGGAASNVTPSVTNAVVLCPIVTSVSDAAHDLQVTKGGFWDAGTGSTTQGTILVAGASPSVAVPTGAWGSRYFFGPNTGFIDPDNNQFPTYGDITMGPLFTTSTTTGGRTFTETQGAQSIRFSIASDLSGPVLDALTF